MLDSHAVEIPRETPALREHLREILDSAAFKGSRRSRQFLQYIVEKSLDGHGDELKERNLGVELFGREPSYDTGQDAIVRVTASDVRRRLEQFYILSNSGIRIEIPHGCYTPEYRRSVEAHISIQPQESVSRRFWEGQRRWVLLLGTLTLTLLAVVYLLARQRWARVPTSDVVPWSHILQAGHDTVIVLADPDFGVMQRLTGRRLSLSDYANGKFIPDLESLEPSMQRMVQTLHGVNVPVVDVGIVVSIHDLAIGTSARLKTSSARTMNLGEFKTNDNFVILGSPRSNPWGGLFLDQLDFDFAYDEETKQEFIRNKRVGHGEKDRYDPTARGWGTGSAFAILAAVGNPNQDGTVLLVGGTTAEATEAAGKLATDLGMLSRSLEKCGISPRGAMRHFEMLLEVRTMAGWPSSFDVKACHPLPDRATP